jgi:tetratricopeptide (TPR) repeat protein
MAKPTLLPDPTCLHLQLLDASQETITAVVTTTAEEADCPLCHGRSASLHGLADVFQHQGRYEQAEQLYQWVLAIREPLLGEEHPDTIEALAGLVNLCRDQGKDAEAESRYQRALMICERCLQQDHPLTQTIRKDYAVLSQAMGSV